MDRRLSLEDLKNERRRQRHALLSIEERRSRRARCRDTDVPSTGSVNGSVDCDSGESVSASVPAVSPSCSGSELMPDVSVDSVLVNDLSASLISSHVGLGSSIPHEVLRYTSAPVTSNFQVGQSSTEFLGLTNLRLCAGVHSDLPRGSSVSLNCDSEVSASSVSVSLGSALEVGQISGATFELGESSTASLGLLNVSFCDAVRDELQTSSSVFLGPNFEIGEASSASVGQHHGTHVIPSPLRRARHRRQPVGRFGRISVVPIVPWVLPSSPSCLHCGAFRFFRESPGFCCSNGQVCLPPPKVCPILRSLFTDKSEIACDFRQRDRTYNNAFAFTSIGMSTDSESWLAKDGIYALKVFGQVFHFINPIDGSPNTKYLLQLFFLESAAELDSEVVAAKGLRNDVMSLIVEALSKNPYSVFFKRLRSWDDLKDAHVVLRSNPCLDQRTHNLPTVDEVAAVWRDSDEGDSSQRRDIRVYTDGTRGHTIKYYYSCYDTLQYPLLFPNGEPGWHAGIKKRDTVLRSGGRKRKDPCVSFAAADPTNMASAEEILEREEQVLEANKNTRSNVSCREFSCYRAQIRPDDNSYLLHSGRLGHQFAIDSYIKLETSRFDYYASEQSQKQFRTESFQGIADALCIDGQTNPSNVGKRVLLPSSFIGGPRDMRKRYVNAMALVQRFGKPDLFLTMTCNPSWKEIKDNLLPCQVPHDRPDLIARVFKAKLEELKDEIVRKKIFGDVAAYVYVVEYQKRGLPHVHWVIILSAAHKIVSADVYDNIISAEIPDHSHPFLRSYVLRHMMHGPCGTDNPQHVCMQDGVCKNHYPKDFSEVTLHRAGTYPSYRRRRDGRSIVIRNVPLDNRWVIPHCPYLLAKFDCHINVEICSDMKLVKYLYKYIYKGHDKASYHIVSNGANDSYDEIQAYQAARYICAPEAFWRIFAFPMSETYPPVIILPVHLPDHQPLRFGMERPLEQLLQNPLSSKTMLTEFLGMNSNNPDARRLNLLYKEFPEHFVWDGTKKKWSLRKRLTVVGRLSTVSPFEGERYFERLLLMHIRCPTSFDHLRTLGSGNVGSFREAALFRGLLESDNYADNCLAEAVFYQMPCSLRRLFALLLVYGVCANPQNLWDKYYSFMSEDFTRDNLLSTVEIIRRTIAAVDNFLISMDRSLSEFSLRFPISYLPVKDRISREYEHEQNMPISDQDRLSINQLNADQRYVYNLVVSRIVSGQGGAFFVDGPGGTGKTFLYRALLAFVRSRKKIALVVASSGVAASLLPGGRTAHSRFKLPLHNEDKSVGSISKQGNLAKMIVAAQLIVWDEASMANRHSIETLDKTLQDLCECRLKFGGKVILFGGDFRQTLPIVVRGARESMIAASIVSSPLWSSIVKLTLHENMRARDDPNFVSYLMRIGNGQEPVVFEDNILIPPNIFIPFVNIHESLNKLIDYVFPSLDVSSADPYSLINRAILTPKNDCVDEINEILIGRFPGETREYVSYNRTLDTMQQGEYEDYLNGVSVSGLPSHILKLKINSPIMLLRNLNPVEGLCNGTRLIIRELGDNFIGAEIAVGEFKGNHVFIPRIPLESTDKLKCPIAFKRMQFPVRTCFAMTINKAQGQTLDFVGVYLREPVFSHGQLYVALSRARTADSVKILVHPVLDKGFQQGMTKNIVYPEIFLLARG